MKSIDLDNLLIANNFVLIAIGLHFISVHPNNELPYEIETALIGLKWLMGGLALRYFLGCGFYQQTKQLAKQIISLPSFQKSFLLPKRKGNYASSKS